MGTIGFGLVLLRDEKIFHFLRKDGLFDGEIYGFASDSEGKLWIACSKGFYSVAKSELLSFAEGKTQKVRSVPYVPLEGLRAIQARRGIAPNAAARRDGDVWFSTVEGLVAYAPHFGKGGTRGPRVIIEEVTVNGEQASPLKTYRFGPGRTNLSFRYTGLSFLDPQGVTFQYLLEGYDADWTLAGTRREAFYTNLPPGNYRFRVSACAQFVPCNEVGSAMNFQIVPYFYEKSWFWLVSLGVFSFLVWLAFQRRVNRLKSQFSLVVAERNRIARELHDTLIQGFSGITMEMQALSTQLEIPAQKSYVEEIIRDAVRCLTETRQSVAELRDDEQAGLDLGEVITAIAERITREYGMQLVLDIDSGKHKMSMATRHHLVSIVQEAILNAARHSSASTVEVSMFYTGQELGFRISDNGIGLTSTGDGDEHHYGIIGMRERAEQLGARFDISSSPGVGTTVTIRLMATDPALEAFDQSKR